MLRTVALLFSIAIAACSMAPVHTSELRIQPMRPMIAQKIARPLYVVLDPAQVPDAYTIPRGTVKEIQIFEIQVFVRRDLRAALETFFDHVEIVAPGTPLPDGALVGQVQIQGFASDVDMVSSGTMTAQRFYGHMTWAFAIREPGANEFAFSHTDSVSGTFPLTTVNQTAEMIGSTYQAALDHLVVKLAAPEVMHRLAGV